MSDPERGLPVVSESGSTELSFIKEMRRKFVFAPCSEPAIDRTPRRKVSRQLGAGQIVLFPIRLDDKVMATNVADTLPESSAAFLACGERERAQRVHAFHRPHRLGDINAQFEQLAMDPGRSHSGSQNSFFE